MDIQIRLVLLIVGSLILLGVLIDVFRRRSSKDLQEDNKIYKSELFNAAVDPDLPDTSYDIVTDNLDQGLDLEVTPDLDVEFRFEAQFESSTELEYNPEPEENFDIKPAPRVVSIYIMSRDRNGFSGSELLNAVKNAHLYFGKNDLFHRYENEDGSGELLFSLIRAHEPGYFYIDLIKQEYILGIALIMLPDNLTSPSASLEKLIRTAKQLAFSLNGELLDHNRESLTLTTINDYATQLKANANR